MADIRLNGQNYLGVDTIELPTVQGGTAVFELHQEPPTPVEENFLTFQSPDEFALIISANAFDGSMEYSTDKTTWTSLDGTSENTMTAISDGTNYNLYLRGTGNTYVTGTSAEWTVAWSLDREVSSISCIGNIENILDYQMVRNGQHPPMANNCFHYMFGHGMGHWDKLVMPPSLPSPTVGNYCYENMFTYTMLSVLPALPATALESSGTMFLNAHGSYANMFNGCNGIKLSDTQTDEYQNEYRIPTEGTATDENGYATRNMFSATGGTFTGTPNINTTYYTSNAILMPDGTIIPAIE